MTTERTLEDLQAMYDEGDKAAFDAVLAEMLDGNEGDDDSETKLLALLEWLRENGNDYGPDDIAEESYDECAFRVNPHTTRDGTSPAKAKAMVATLRKALGKLNERSWVPVFDDNGDMNPTNEDGETDAFPRMITGNITRDQLNEVGYDTLARYLREDCPEVLEIGLHDVLNTLYFVSEKTDDYDNAVDHRDTIREAFDGVDIKDRTRPRQTEDASYLVLTDDEADGRMDDWLEGCLDDEGIVPGASSRYFDRDLWKKDASQDGRGNALSGYDGEEREHRGFYIYQVG